MAAHARLSPSAAERWFACPGSIAKTAGAPRTSNVFAAEGTVLHEIAAQCLEFGLEPHDYVGQTLSADGFSFEITEEHAECMLPGLDWLRDQPGRVFIEKRVNLAPWMPGNFGTLDVGILPDLAVDQDGLCTIVDWKFGEGQPVSPVKHKQSLIYCFGFLQTILRPLGIEPKRFRIVILQPRCTGGGGEWEISLEDLLAFAEEARTAAARCDDPNAPLHAGEKQCFYCPANPKNGGPGCEELDRFVLDLFSNMFDDAEENEALGAPPMRPALTKMTPARMVHIWRHSKMATTWLESIHVKLIDDAIAGHPAPGLKLVAGRAGDRYYADDEVAEAILTESLGAEAFTKKLKSPAQAEKDIKPKRGKPGDPDAWSKLSKIITQDQGKPALTTLDDDRPALQSVDDMFDEED